MSWPTCRPHPLPRLVSRRGFTRRSGPVTRSTSHGFQSVGKTCYVGGIAGQVLGQTAHRGRLFKPQRGAGLQRSQAELAGNLSEVSLGTLGHRKRAWTAGIAIGTN